MPPVAVHAVARAHSQRAIPRELDVSRPVANLPCAPFSALTLLAVLAACGSDRNDQPNADDAGTLDNPADGAVSHEASDAASAPDAAPDDAAAEVTLDDAGTEHDAGTEPVPELDAGRLEDGIPDGANIVKLVAPSVCTVELGYMFNCHFGPVVLEAPAASGGGQFKTRVVGHKQGDCSTQYPFVVELSADGILATKVSLFLNDETFLRRDDSAALSNLTVKEGSAFAGNAEYDVSCRVWLEVDFNVKIGS